jgi:hypothetical protein
MLDDRAGLRPSAKLLELRLTVGNQPAQHVAAAHRTPFT